MAASVQQIRELIIRAREDGVSAITAKVKELAEAQQKLGAAGDSAGEAIERKDRKTLRAAASFEALTRRVDAAARIHYEMGRAVEQATAALALGRTTQEEATRVLDLLAEKQMRLNGSYVDAEQEQAELTARGRAYTASLNPMVAAQDRFNAALAEADRLKSVISDETFAAGIARARSELDAAALSASDFTQSLSDVAKRVADVHAYRRKIDPQFAAQEDYDKEVATANKYYAEEDITEDEWKAGLDQAKARLDATTAALQRQSEAQEKVTGKTRLTTHEMRNLGYQVNDIVTMLAMGQSPFMILSTQGGQVYQVLSGAEGGVKGALKDIGGRLQALLTPARLVAGGLAGIGIAAGLAWKDWNDSQAEVRRSLLGIGQASGATVGQIDAIAVAAAQTGRVSEESARQMAAAFAQTGQISPDLFGPLIASAKDFGRIVGSDAADAAKTLARALADPARGAAQLNEVLGAFDLATLQRIRSLDAQNRVTEAQQIIIDKLKTSVEGAERTTSTWTRSWENFAKTISGVWTGIGKNIDYMAGDAPLEVQKAALEKAIAVQKKSIEGIRGSLLYAFRVPEAEENLEQLKLKLEDIVREMQRLQDKAEEKKRNTESVKYESAIGFVLPERNERRELADRAALMAKLAADPAMQAHIGVTQEETWQASERAAEAMRSYQSAAQQSVQQLQLQADAMNAKSPAEKAAVAARQMEYSLLRSGLGAAEKQYQIELARNISLREATKQLQDQAKARADSVRDEIGSVQAEIAAIGKPGYEADLLKKNYQTYADLRREAEQNHIEFDRAQYERLQQQNAELARMNQILRERQLIDDIGFERAQLGRTSEDQQIASQLRSAGLAVDLNSTTAQLLRMNQALAETKTFGTSALSGFLNDLRQGTSAAKAFESVLDKIYSRAIDKVSDQVMGSILGGTSGGVAGLLSGGKAGAANDNPLVGLFGGGKVPAIGGAMTVTAGTVYVNGALLGASGIGISNSGVIGGWAGSSSGNMAGVLKTSLSYTGLNEDRDNAAIRGILSADSVSASLNPAEQAWCAAYANAVLARNNMPTTGSNLASSFRDWGQATGTPSPGDIVNLRSSVGSGHVGFFNGYDGAGNVLVSGGNQGDAVSTKAFPADQVISFRTALGGATSATNSFGNGLSNAANQAADALSGTASSLTSAGSETQKLTTATQGATSGLGQFANGLGSALEQLLKGIGGALKGVGEAFSGLLSGGSVHAATGGLITGPGTGTSDSIPALLSNGEFVINAAAARRFAPLLQAINDNRPLARFAAGGPVGGGHGPAGFGPAPVSIQVINNAGAQVQATSSTGPGGAQQITVMIDAVKSALIDDLRRDGDLSRSIGGRFGLSPARGL